MKVSAHRVALAAIATILFGCSPKWPSDRFPEGLEVKRTLFASGSSGFREACEALVVEITDDAAYRVSQLIPTKNGVVSKPPSGWKSTPIANGKEPTFYEGAFGGCDAEGDRPFGDLPGWLGRPGAFYKVVNGGEGIAIIVPRAKMAAFYYFG